jgi:hypothetical protein
MNLRKMPSKGKSDKNRGKARTSDELKILASIESEPKLIEKISQDTKIPLKQCHVKIAALVDVGLLVVEHDSDLYGHEVVKVRRVSKKLDN